MKTRLMAAFLMMAAAVGVSGGASYSTIEKGDMQGAWVNSGTTTAGFYARDSQGQAALAFYKDRTGKPKAADFAITAMKDEMFFQIVDDKGEVHKVPVTALLKLK